MSNKNKTDSLKTRQNASFRSKAKMHEKALKETSSNSSMGKLLEATVLTDLQNSASKPSWDALNELERSIAQGIYEFAVSVGENILAITASNTAANKTSCQFETISKTALNDFNTFSHQVKAIRVKHENKKGFITDPFDLDLYYQCGNEYNDIYDRFKQIGFQHASEIMSYLAEISQDLKDAEATSDVSTADAAKDLPLSS